MSQTATLVWTAPQDCESGWHAEFARLELWASGLRAAGTQLGIEPVPYRLEYRLDAGGEGFATRCLRVEVAGDGWERHLRLERHPNGDWAVEVRSEGQGELPPPGGDPEGLAGALDCDLAFSPLTNAMPVLRHRLHRKPGTVDLVVAWVSVPALSVHALTQRYTHLGSTGDGARVRYESLEDGEVVFAQDLELDPRGLVRLYPRLARRIDAATAGQPERTRSVDLMAATPKSRNVELVAELHRRQGEMYGGGSIASVLELLTEDIVWHVPGTSPIAGDHRGGEAVAAYFARRRELAHATMRMQPGAVLADGDAVVQLVDGSAKLHGRDVSWRTAGVYRVHAGRVAEVWLVPLDLRLFDQVWSA